MTPYDALCKLFNEWLPERDLETTCYCGNLIHCHGWASCVGSWGHDLPSHDSPFYDWLANKYQIAVFKSPRSDYGTTYDIMKMNCVHAVTGCTISGCCDMTPERNIDDLIDFKGERWITYFNSNYIGNDEGFWSRGPIHEYKESLGNDNYSCMYNPEVSGCTGPYDVCQNCPADNSNFTSRYGIRITPKQETVVYKTVPIFDANGVTLGYADPVKFLDAIMSPNKVELKLIEIDSVLCLSDITNGIKTCIGSSCSRHESCREFVLDKGIDLSPDGKFYPMKAL